MLPATAILIAVVHIQRSGSSVWLPAVILLAIATVLGEVGVASGLIATVVRPEVCHVGAAAIFVLAASGVLSVGLTVAERERVEAALARTDARLRALMESSSDVLTVSDALPAHHLRQPRVRARPRPVAGQPARHRPARPGRRRAPRPGVGRARARGCRRPRRTSQPRRARGRARARSAAGTSGRSTTCSATPSSRAWSSSSAT